MKPKYPENIILAWDDEPNVNALWEATELLTTNPLLALSKLEYLAGQGSALSKVYLGDAYLYGRGVERDYERGELWLKRAAEQGSIEGAFRLARHYQGAGEFAKAESEFIKLGDRGFSPAMHTLGNMYFNGEGVTKNIDKALECWTRAERCGHLIAKQRASFLLRSGHLGLIGRLKGYIKLASGLIPFIKYRSEYPDSDRLRN